MGGLSGKANIINTLKSNLNTPLLLLDAGNLLFKKDENPDQNPASLITAHGIVRAYKQLSYDAVAVSSHDLRGGIVFFETSRAMGFPWISANVFDNNGLRLFRPFIVRKVGEENVGIIGLTGQGVTTLTDSRIGDWRESLPAQIAELEKTCGVIILLSTLSDEENLEIAQNHSQIDVLIAASPNMNGNIPTRLVGNSLLAQSEGRGKYIGKLELKWHPQGTWPNQSLTESRQHLHNRMSAIDLQIKNFTEQQKDHNQESRESDFKIHEMQKIRQTISDQLASLEAMSTDSTRIPVYSNTYISTFLPVKPVSSGDSVDNIVQDIKKNLNAYQKSRLANQHSQTNQEMTEVLQRDDYTGITACKNCHQKQTDFWTGTAHAGAFTTLVKTGQSYNSECLPCHVTGGNIDSSSAYGKREMLLFLPENRQLIGCEVCHGPGRQHSLTPEESLPVRIPAQQTCLSCHTPERDGDFQFKTKIKQIACPKSQ